MHLRAVCLLASAVLAAGEANMPSAGPPGRDVLALLRDPTVMSGGGVSTLVAVGGDGRLAYTPDADGNRIADFSFAGYGNGGVGIPLVAAAVTLKPAAAGGDDTERIQQAIDRVARQPLSAAGLRGAVLLTAGRYEVSRPLRITVGGIVLRGEGADFSGTWLFHRRPAGPGAKPASMTVHDDHPEHGIEPTVAIAGTRLMTAAVAEVRDAVLPAGSRELTLDALGDLRVGERIQVVCRMQRPWIDALGLSRHWKVGTIEPRCTREIVAIDAAAKRITLDRGLTVRLDRAAGHVVATIQRPTDDGRISQVGVEDILFISDYDRSVVDRFGYVCDERHANNAVRISHVDQGWVRRCTAFFYSFSGFNVQHASRVTIEDCAVLDGVSADTPRTHAGARKYAINLCGNDLLAQRCYVRLPRHAFTGSGAFGTVVFLDCFSEREHLASEWHQSWGHGVLYDNVATRSPISLGGIGTSPHGQRAAFSVMWNCLADNRRTFESDIRVNAMPGLFANYAIGCIARGSGRLGRLEEAGSIGVVGTIESPGRFVEPRSLYLAQLADRLGAQAVAAVAAPAQISGARGAVWKALIERYADQPLWADPAAAPWK